MTHSVSAINTSPVPFFRAYDGPGEIGHRLAPYVRGQGGNPVHRSVDPNTAAGGLGCGTADSVTSTPPWQRTVSSPGRLAASMPDADGSESTIFQTPAATPPGHTVDGACAHTGTHVPDIDWSSLARTPWSPSACFARAARDAAQPVTVYFSGAGVDSDYDGSSPLGRRLTQVGHALPWANGVADELARTYYRDPDIDVLPVIIDRHFEDGSDLHVFGLSPWIPESPFIDVTTDRGRAQAAMPADGALYRTTLPRGDLLITPHPGVFLLPGHVSTPIERLP